MIHIHIAFLFSLFALNMNGGGSFIDERMVLLALFCIAFIHILCLIAYYRRIVWLRVVCVVLYLPVFAIPIVLSGFDSGFLLLLVPTIAFYVFTIVRTRK